MVQRNNMTTLWLLVCTTCGLAGCNSIGVGKQLQQLESDNNRLLTEFRAERQRRENAERTAQQLEQRLAESEKLIARQMQAGTGPGRLSSLPSSPALPSSSMPDPSSLLNRGGASDSPSTSHGSGDLKWYRRN